MQNRRSSAYFGAFWGNYWIYMHCYMQKCFMGMTK